MSDSDIMRLSERLARLEAIAEHQPDLHKAVLSKLGELEQELRLHAAALDGLTESAPPTERDVPMLVAEVQRLTTCLAKANANHEDFERRWYLACDERDAIEQRTVAAIVNWLERLIGEGIERERPYLIESLRAGRWKP